MKTFTVTFYDITYAKAERITVPAETPQAAEWLAGQRCSIPAGFRETLRVEETEEAANV